MRHGLLDEARRLSVPERVELAAALWDTVAEDASAEVLPVSQAHQNELDRRLSDLAEDPEAASSWSDVRSRLERQG